MSLWRFIMCLSVAGSIATAGLNAYQQRNIASKDYLNLNSIGCTNLEYVVLVDKSRKELYLGQYNENNESVSIKKRYHCSTGLKEGDKHYAGDNRTPVGNYQIIGIRENISDEYGPKAFVLDYPNANDKLQGKTGSGIWIHGSVRYQGPTKGCIRLSNNDLIELGSYVLQGTKVIIREEL